MNGLGADLAEIAAMRDGLWVRPADCDVLVCPPATLLSRAAAVAEGAFALGGQDCAMQDSGAYTGEISAAMLKDAGASAVILGHSERRLQHLESDAVVAAKVRAAWRAGLSAIVCVGETEAERGAGQARTVCRTQVFASLPPEAGPANAVLAYEPVWAIGSGHTPPAEEIAAMHGVLRECLVELLGSRGAGMRILYGGSVKPANAAAILSLPHVDGALIGGASLKARDFLAIIGAATFS